MDMETLTIEIRDARRDVERAKLLYGNGQASYDDMAAAARRLSALFYEYQRVRFPHMRAKRIPYQSILR